MRKSRLTGPMILAALIALVCVPLVAQQAGGKIAGTVRDSGGAPLVGATVEIKNQTTGAVRLVRTSATGTYALGELTPGFYSVHADMPGFRRTSKIVSLSDAPLVVDLALELNVSENVTVTAMKREETVFSTPISVAAPTEEDLREHGINNIEEVAANVADFTVQNLGPGQSQVSMRGVSSGQIARDQPGPKEEVGTYLDESVISFLLFTPDIDFFDMNRIEVLRGPQGTLFGSGSLSGAVRYITNQPELGVNQYFGELAGNTVVGGGQGGDAKVGFNAPLSNTVALRLVAYYNRFAGFMDAVQPDFSVKSDVNSGDRTGMRAALAISPDEDLSITPRFVYQTVKMDGWNRNDIFNILANPFTTTRPPVTLGERQLFTQLDEPYNDKFLLGDLNVRYNFGDFVLTSITSYIHRDIDVIRDAGALTSSITGGSYGFPEDVYTLNAPLDDHTTAKGWTEELRVSGGKDRLRWVGGAFYSDAKKTYGQSLFVGGFEALEPGVNTRTVATKDILFFSDLSYKTRQYAFFGEGTFDFTNRLGLTAGLRYYNYKDDKKQIFDGLFGAGADGKPQSTPGTTKADGVAPRFIVSYKVTDSTTINAQASKGFRLGGINDPLNVNLCTDSDKVTFGNQPGFKDETDWNYEIGSKSRIFGGRGSVNATAFYDDIKNLQVVVTAGSCSSRLVYSVPKARSVGGELEFTLAPTENLDFSVATSYTDATLRSTVTSTAPDQTVSIVSGIESGKRLPSVPKFQIAVAATYQQPITPGFVGYLTGTYQHIGSRFTQVGDDLLGTLDLNSFGANTIGGPLTQSTFTYNPLLPAYDIVNLRLGVRHGNWDVAFYGNNLTDERALLSLDRERGTRARIGFLTNQPRTFGISSRVDF